MKDNEVAGIALIKHVTRRLDEFLYENTPGRFQTIEEMQQGFSRWLKLKETQNARLKFGDGMIAEQVFAEDICDEHSATLASLKVFANGRLGIMWLPQLFTISGYLCDEMRDELVALLRFHANKLEDRSLDTRMRECAGNMGMGAA